MNEAFVADCSVGVGWVHPSQSGELTKRLLDEAKAGAAVHVPSLWHLEIANVLLVAVRRKLMTEKHRSTGLVLLRQLKIVVDLETSELAFSSISEIAAKHHLSTYDAAYLELAKRRAIPLASRDEELKTAARKIGVALR